MFLHREDEYELFMCYIENLLTSLKTTEGKRKKGSLKSTWRRTAEANSSL